MSDKVNFGFKKVAVKDKPSMVNEVFDVTSKKYDLMNDLMSFGLHRYWKKIFVSLVDSEDNLLDLGGGTGDIAIRFIKNGGHKVTICDPNKSMLDIAQARVKNLFLEDHFSFVIAKGEDLPFADNSFDALSISFALRNVTLIDKVLKEIYRVLKPAGTFFCLEFSKPPLDFIAKLYDKYSFEIIPIMGKIISNNEDSYRYLVQSIRKFPNQEQLLHKIKNTGFINSSYQNLSSGIVAIHRGTK